MNIRIGDNTYLGSWTYDNDGNGRFLFSTNLSAGEIEDVFDPGNAPLIEVLDENDEVVAVYHNRFVTEISITNKEIRYAEIKFIVNKIKDDVEVELREGIDDNTNGVVDLADWIQDLEDRVATLEEIIGEGTEVE